MARKNKLEKTKFQNIYEVTMDNGEKHYIAKFIHNSKRYPEKNFTKLYGIKTAKTAFDKLTQIRYELSKGNDVFSRKSSKIDELIKKYFDRQSSDYKKNGLATYNKHIKPIIGHLKIDKVTKDHILKIIHNMENLDLSSNTIRKIKTYLNPIFKDAYNDEIVRRNVLEKITFKANTPKPDLKDRLNESLEVSIKKIYEQALKFENSYSSCFLVSIMCGRRIGEICKIEYQDIIDGWVHARASTTKTYKKTHHSDSIVETYPLPKEVIDRINFENKNPSEKVFNHYKRTYQDKYKGMIEDKCNLKTKPLYEKYPVRTHDNRYFIISILIKEFNIDIVGSICLSHSSRSSNMNMRYTSIEDSHKIKIYERYWEILRS